MDEFLVGLSNNPQVQACSGGQGVTYKFLGAGQETPHIHQSKWRQVCAAIVANPVSPLIVVGHSNGGAAAVSLSHCLAEKNIGVDLLITADSVKTADDLGDSYGIPANVVTNINTFLAPNVITFTLPFPFGHANHRDGADSSAGIVNVGLNYLLPGAVAHRNAFYDFAGRDKNADGSFQLPFTVYDLSLATLLGASSDTVQRMAVDALRVLSTKANVDVDVSSATLQTTLKPTKP
jgi:hypothetical protein